MRKTRIKYYKHIYMDFDEGLSYWYSAKIQVRILGIWWTINTIKDESDEYVHNRAEEVLGYLTTEN